MILYKKKSLPVLIVLLLTIMISGCQNTTSFASAKPLSRTSFVLGTVVEISIYDSNDEKILDKAFDRIAEIEKKMTINNAETSEIIELNNASGKNEVKLSADTFFVLEKGRQYSELSNGKFDITIGPIVKLWNINTNYAAVPEKSKLVEAVGLVNYRKLSLNKEKLTAKLEDPDMKVDLGAIAKGYAADEAARILKENGVLHAIINLGGNVMTVGGNPNESPWKIGIRDPFNPKESFIAVLPAKDQTVVTSGVYERFFEEAGKKYHHILDPSTGYPTDNNLYSVSIIAGKSIDGDGLSTTTLLIGLEEGLKLIESLDHVEAIFITNRKQVYVTSGLKKDLKITKAEFKLAN